MRLDQAQKRVAERVRHAREAAGLTQEEVAARLGHIARGSGEVWIPPQQFVSKVERGKRELKAAEARWFARALDVDPEWLLGGLGVPGENVTIKGATAIAPATPGLIEALLK